MIQSTAPLRAHLCWRLFTLSAKSDAMSLNNVKTRQHQPR